MTECAEPESIELLPLSEPALAAFLQDPTTSGQPHTSCRPSISEHGRLPAIVDRALFITCLSN
jgi:hypothetical protein